MSHPVSGSVKMLNISSIIQYLLVNYDTPRDDLALTASFSKRLGRGGDDWRIPTIYDSNSILIEFLINGELTHMTTDTALQIANHFCLRARPLVLQKTASTLIIEFLELQQVTCTL